MVVTSIQAISMGNYPHLAGLMSSYQDVVIFRTFSRLNIRNLIYIQAELAHLETELDEATKRDSHCNESSRRDYAVSWEALRDCAAGGRDSTQLRIVIRIRELLEKYSEQKWPGRSSWARRSS